MKMPTWATTSTTRYARFGLETVGRDLRRPRTFDEILAPIRRDVAQHGGSEAEVDQLLVETRDATW